MTNLISNDNQISQNSNQENQQQSPEKIDDFNEIQITDKEIDEQKAFLNQFSNFSPVKHIEFLTKRYESKFMKTTKVLQDLIPTIKEFYENQIQNADRIRKEILSRLNNINYSMNKLDAISNFLNSYSAFRTLCVTAKMQLETQQSQYSSHQVFEQVILLYILKTHRSNILNSFLTIFKLFPLVRRREILSITSNKLMHAIEIEQSSVHLINNSNERIMNELSRLSQFFNIDFDLEKEDGQHFIYSCEKVLSEYQRHQFSFQQVPIETISNSNLNDCINTSFISTHTKNELLVEAFENILNRNNRYHVVVYNAVNNKTFTTEQIQALIDLRFCRNRQLFAELEKSTHQVFEYKHKIERNLGMNCEVKENEENAYISFIVEEILIFGSAVIDTNNQKVDLDPLLEFSIEKFVRYTKAKIKLLSIFCEISRHSNSQRIHECMEKIINKRPNLIYKTSSFFEKFDIQIDVLEKVGCALNLLLNLHFLSERHITSFLGSNYELFQFGSVYSNEAIGDFNLNYFEVYPLTEKILDFFSISEKVVDDLCSTFSINSIEYRDYIEFSVWSQLLDELSSHPEKSIFGFDYSTIHFNLEVSSDILSFIECKLLDDPDFIKQFIDDCDSSKKSEFAVNLSHFVHLVSKLRVLITKTNILLPTYLRQFDEAHYSVNTSKTIDFIRHSFNFTDYEKIRDICMKGDFSELVEIIDSQRRYNSLLKIAIQFNNFRSDNYYTSFLFNLESPNNYFFITKEPSHHHETKTIKLLHEAAKRLFTSIDEMMDQDFSAIFYDISDIDDFTDPTKLISKSKSYIARIELAVMTNYERILLSEFQPFELFGFNEDILINNSFNFLSIPQFSQCLMLDSNNIDKILKIVSIRLNLIGFVRFESFLNRNNNKFYELLNDHQNIWESNFFSKLNTSLSLDEALNVFESMQLFQMTRLNLGVLLLLQKVFQTKRAIHLPEKVKPGNLSLISDDEIRAFWTAINNQKDSEKLFNMIVIERYIPNFIANLTFSCSNIFKQELGETMVAIDLKVERNVMDTDSTNYVLKCCEYMKKQIINEFLKFAYLRLLENVSFEQLNPLSIVEIKRKQYKQLLPLYTSNIIIHASQNLPEEKIPEVELYLTNKILKISSEVIQTVLGKMQRQKLYNESIQIEKELLTFQSLESPMKPECYSKKKTILKSDYTPCNPNPEDANRQFDQEMKYANSKINQAMSNFAKEIQNQNSFDLENPKVKSNLNTLQSFLSTFFIKSRPQTLKTWYGYSKNMKNVTSQKIEEDIQFNDLVLAMKQQFQYYFTYELSVKISDSYLLLCSLRDKEKESMHDQQTFEKEATAQIKEEYDLLLHDLQIEKMQLLKRFPQIHDQYFKKFENVVNVQKQNGFNYIENLAPNHDIATQSLQISKVSAQEMDQIKQDELKQQDIIKEKEEERKRQERLFEAETLLKSKNLPSIDIDAMTVTKPQTPLMLIDPTNPRNNRRTSHIHVSNSVIKLSELSHSPHHRRRRTICKSQTMGSLLEEAQRDESSESSPKFTPKKHVGSIAIQKSMELLIQLEQTQKEELDIHNNKQKTDENTLKETETEIIKLRKQILKERIVKCLHRIATERHYSKQINVISDEKREASKLLWINHKLLEEQTREFNDELADCFKRLGRAENEIDNLKQDLDAEKAITTKLAHWKDLNLRSSDEILKKIGIYQKGPNVDVNKLLLKLEAKREELDMLNYENDEFENQLEIQVREPMEEITRIRKMTQQQQFQNYQKTIENNQITNTNPNSKQLEKALKLNSVLKRDNEEIKQKIAELEKQKQEIPPLQLNATKDLLSMDRSSTGRRRANYMNANRGKTALTARSPYASIGHRTIIKPIA